jgi:hypothetical protein
MHPRHPRSKTLRAATVLCILASAGVAHSAPLPAPQTAAVLGQYVVLSWNDLGMHCMNKDHVQISVLPPYNNLYAQVIRRGDATTKPAVVTTGLTIEYSVPGNTTSVGKTDFWTWAPALFGVNLPPDVGLGGKGLSGTLDAAGSWYRAIGIPVTPFTDAAPTVEDPFQLALVIARDSGGNELARSTPVIPVSTEIGCVQSGCHASVSAILNGHPREAGFDPTQTPILCAKCHADPALGTTGIADAGYFSFRMHDQHKFMDQGTGGTALCYKCHPGPQTRCLRGAMSERHGLTCQDCHGNMSAMASSIELGRVPWASEPRCANCHLPAYAENPGTLFRNSFGHGGVACEGCHNSTHADLPSREARDNANNIALQGHAGSLGDCKVCHGVTPGGAGPHGMLATADVGPLVLGGARAMRVTPNPVRDACRLEWSAAGGDASTGRLVLFDAGGRTVRVLDPIRSGDGMWRVAWDARDQFGRPVPAGTYFARAGEDGRRIAARVTVVR